MWIGILLLALAAETAPDTLALAYRALQARQYEQAVSLFRTALVADPKHGAAHKDLAYTYLKIGEREEARDQFGEAMRLDPGDQQAALEYAFLCYETRQQAEARRTFLRLRDSAADQATRETAAKAFANIDEPLAAGIQRWSEALRRGDDSFTTHYELALLAEQRDEAALAAEHYEKAWRIAPANKSVLIDLGRTWKALQRDEEAASALLAASRGGETRAAERARKLLPARYPYIYEFRNALAFDPRNTELRRELGFLLLRMHRQAEAEEEFRKILSQDPPDPLAAAQLGFLYLARGESDAARPLLDGVVSGRDQELANRARAVLRLPQVEDKNGPSAREMAERSIKAGYLKDARKYLEAAHEADPVDFAVMLRLGWICNLLHDDREAVRWFDLARQSSDPEIAAQAQRSWRNLRAAQVGLHVSAWVLPSYSTRWRDTFSYGQVKAEWNAGLPVRPYLSLRVIADTRSHGDPIRTQLFSESAVILGAGLATRPWRGALLWGEAGWSAGYLSRHVVPDYRGGLSFARTTGRRWFLHTAADALFVSRFQYDTLFYFQNRAGYDWSMGPWKLQFYANGNVTADVQRQSWANFVETGPGIRLRSALPDVPAVSVDFVRGMYTTRPGRGSYSDLRIGFWYALSR